MLRRPTMRLLLTLTAELPFLACSPLYPTAVQIKLATVPIGDTASVLSEPVRENQSIRFTWTVETSLQEARYLEWVAAGLGRQGFTVQQRKEHSLMLSSLEDGDAYRLSLDVTQANPTRVRLTLTMSPR